MRQTTTGIKVPHTPDSGGGMQHRSGADQEL